MIFPSYLKPGDTIGVVCPAGYMAPENSSTCIEILQQWGFKVKKGKTLSQQHHYFSGTDKERLNDLQQMLDDKDVKAILCARGGYGTTRIIDEINWKKFKKNPKWIIGFSDITALHSVLYAKLKIASLHAPMAAAFNDGEINNEYVQSLYKTLVGEKTNYQCDTHPLNLNGTARGKLLGGNLSLLAHQLSTRTDINTIGKILFIEDVGEYLYHLDRMMLQLDRAGKLTHLAGLVVGGFTDMKDTTIPFGQTAEEIILHHVSKYKYPVCFGFPVGHQRENYCLKSGATYELKVSKQIKLREL